MQWLRWITLVLAGAVSACSSFSTNAPAVSEMPPAVEGPSGMMVGTANRLTLYYFDQDGLNQSHCDVKCAATWQPLLAHDDDVARGEFEVFTRADGSKQWSLIGHPLYFYVQDNRMGDMHGDKVDGQWHVFKAKPIDAAPADLRSKR